MGSLVSTVATRAIIRHLNKTFGLQRIHRIRHEPPSNDPAGNGQYIQTYFAPAPGGAARGWNLHQICTGIKHGVSQRPGGEIFLPEDFGPRSPNAEQRWLWFLDTTKANVLTGPNNTAIMDAIYSGLTDAGTAKGTLKYGKIEFDCIDSAPVGGQFLLVSDETDDNGTLYKKIVLCTPPMDPNVPVALDPQPQP
jgi:hypothetical protein